MGKKIHVPGIGEVNYKHLPSFRPPGSKARSVMTTEAVVDPTRQPLRHLRPYEAACLHISPLLGKEAQIVLQTLFSCFEKQGSVQEGLIGDILWGFAQTPPPIPPQLTIVGLKQLYDGGYIKFQAKDNTYVDFSSDKIEGAFVRYQPSLLEMVYESKPVMEIRTKDYTKEDADVDSKPLAQNGEDPPQG